jgi:palmitoyltransferase
MFSKNKQGLGIMHIAAQGDQPLVLTYFYNQGLRDDTVDEKGGSPLHWATYLGCEQATALLLAWGAEVNLQDADLQTPLHLGTLAGNTRIVRNLLLKGAERGIRDKDNHTAMDLAREAGAEAVVEMLKEPGPFSDCSIKPPLRPYSHSRKSMLIYVIGFSCGLVLNLLFSLQCRAYIDNEVAVGTLYLAFTLASLASFLVVSNLDPGYVTPPPYTDLLVSST